MQILRVDVTGLQVRREEVPASYEHLGGRSLIAKILLDEVQPGCDSLGPRNKLTIAPGLLGGAGVTTAGRLSIGAKSPLTRGSQRGKCRRNCGRRAWKARPEGHRGRGTTAASRIPHLARLR